MSGQGYKRKRRRALFRKQQGKCHWCGGEMVLPDVYPTRGKMPRNLCTVDHLRSRFHPARNEPANGTQRWVAACWQCNNDRCQAEQAAMPIQVLREKSGRGVAA